MSEHLPSEVLRLREELSVMKQQFSWRSTKLFPPPQDGVIFIAYGYYVKSRKPFVGECYVQQDYMFDDCDENPTIETYFINPKDNFVGGEEGCAFDYRLDILGWMPLPKHPEVDE